MESINENRKLGYWNIDLIPFSATVPYLANISEPYAFRNILGKIIRYVPMGIFFPLVFKNLNRFNFFLLVCLMAVLVIESLQFVLMVGYFDIYDIILNMFCCVVGYLFVKAIKSYFKAK
jgi:glycopeptide antibiotics resistance protein